MVAWGNSGSNFLVLDRGQLRPATTTEWLPDVPPETGPFAIADFGTVDRLAWAAGACAVQGGTYGYWGQRYGFSLQRDALRLWDATRPVVVTLTATGLFRDSSYGMTPRAHVGWLWFQYSGALCAISLADLEGLFERESGPLQIEVEETFPHRDPNARFAARVLEVASKAMTLKLPDDRTLLIPKIDGVVVGMEIDLFDQIRHNVFHAADVPGRGRVILNPHPSAEIRIAAQLMIEPAVDPAGGPITIGEAPSRQADLDRLFNALADDPDDAATREILVDLLEDSGEPYASVLHELIAGNTDKRREALGAIERYLTAIEYRGGLWASAALSAGAPLDPDIGDAIANDQRLGFLHTLRIGSGAFAVYARLVAAPRAVGLRHVDVPNGQVLAALIAGKRTNLTQLSNVKFATRAVIDGLAHPTFDRVQRLHSETAASFVAKQLQFFIRDEAGFFARAPRHLILTERDGFGDRLIEPVRAVLDKLPIESVTIGALTLTR